MTRAYVTKTYHVELDADAVESLIIEFNAMAVDVHATKYVKDDTELGKLWKAIGDTRRKECGID